MRRGALIGAVLVLAGTAAEAAPIRPFGPADICGDVAVARWQPRRTVEGMPGFSGSLGRTRTFPARFALVLRNPSGLDAAAMKRLNGLLKATAAPLGAGDGELLLLVNSDVPGLLDTARRICVTAYRVRGDEGGTWAYHDRIEVRR